MNENSLNNKFNRVDSAIAEMRQNLNLQSTDSIETVAETTALNLKKLMNIFIQQEEPETKDGIWIKSDPFEYNEIKVDETFVIKGQFEPETMGSVAPYTMGYASVVEWNKELYFLNMNHSSYTTGRMYRFDEVTGSIIEVPEFAQNQNNSNLSRPSTAACTCLYKDIVYIYTTNGLIHTYNMQTHEYSSFNIPSDANDHYMFNVENKIFLLTGANTDSRKSYCIDAITHEILDIVPNAPSTINTRIGQSIYYGGKYYLSYHTSTHSSKKTYLFDPVTYEYTDVTKTHGWFCGASAERERATFLYDNYAYYSSSYGVTFFNLIDYTTKDYSFVNDMGLTSGLKSDSRSRNFIYNNKYYFISEGNPYYIVPTSAITTPCNENTLIIRQGKYKINSQLVSLYNIPVTTGKIEWPVQDVLYYKDGQYQTKLQVYYGNGTAWNKLK